MARKSQHISDSIRAKLEEARVARLATLDAQLKPHIIPVCFVYDGSVFFTAVDRKPKSVAPEKLARLRNIARAPQVALLIDEYCEDWAQLWFILGARAGKADWNLSSRGAGQGRSPAEGEISAVCGGNACRRRAGYRDHSGADHFMGQVLETCETPPSVQATAPVTVLPGRRLGRGTPRAPRSYCMRRCLP